MSLYLSFLISKMKGLGLNAFSALLGDPNVMFFLIQSEVWACAQTIVKSKGRDQKYRGRCRAESGGCHYGGGGRWQWIEGKIKENALISINYEFETMDSSHNIDLR